MEEISFLWKVGLEVCGYSELTGLGRCVNSSSGSN